MAQGLRSSPRDVCTLYPSVWVQVLAPLPVSVKAYPGNQQAMGPVLTCDPRGVLGSSWLQPGPVLPLGAIGEASQQTGDLLSVSVSVLSLSQCVLKSKIERDRENTLNSQVLVPFPYVCNSLAWAGTRAPSPERSPGLLWGWQGSDHRPHHG